MKAAAEESIKRAAEEAMELNDGDKSIGVTLDGSCQKKLRHTSINSTVYATSVLDVEVTIKYYLTCPKGGHLQRHKGKCQRNYEGSRGGMETALEIFQRERLHKVRYVKYLEDSRYFLAVQAASPYDDSIEISEQECTRHVEKMNRCET